MGISRVKLGPSDTMYKNTEGTAAVEFAILLPVLLLLVVGVIEVLMAVTFDRKVSRTAAAIGDLISRSQSLSNTDMEDLRVAIRQQMAPFFDAPVTVTLGVVNIVNERPQTVWSWSNDGSDTWPAGSDPGIFDFSHEINGNQQIAVNGQYYVLSRVQMEYQPILGDLFAQVSAMIGPDLKGLGRISLSETYAFLPRIAQCVEFNNRCATWKPKKSG